MASRSVLQLLGIAYVELYVANVYQASFFYSTALGFRPVGSTGAIELRHGQVSVLLTQGEVRLVLTGATQPDSAIAQHVHRHGDTVRDVALLVADAREAFVAAMTRGASCVSEPAIIASGHGRGHMVKATIAGPGDTVHSFVEIQTAAGDLLPGFSQIAPVDTATDIGIVNVDHVAVGLPAGSLDKWVEFYRAVLGFRQSHGEMIWSPTCGMNSKVVEDLDGRVRIPIVESAAADCQSQIDEFVAFHHGPGAQHVAFATRDIVTTVGALRARGVRCLAVPAAYYEELRSHLPDLDHNERARFEAAGVLVDSEEGCLLLQTFTEPLHSRPTLFLELIERRGATGFGARNIRALFEAVDRERARRGATAAVPSGAYEAEPLLGVVRS